MRKLTKVALLATGGMLILVLALGASIVFAQGNDNGSDAVPEDETTVPEDDSTVPGTQSEQPQASPVCPGGYGHAGLPEGLTSRDQLLADALGVDVETLQAARESARAAAIEQALAEDLITQEQADMLLNGDFGLHRGHGFQGFGGSIDSEALLADALGISVADLQAAEQQAHEAALAEMVDSGYLTEEEAQLMAAREALEQAIDRKALMADVLGISQTELEDALSSHESMATLIENSGMTADEFQAAMQAAYQAAAEQAVADGVITAEQLDALQSAGLDTFGLGGHGFGGHHGSGAFGGHGGPGRHGGFGVPGAMDNGGASFHGSKRSSTMTARASLSL
jgi:hypothetical protein